MSGHIQGCLKILTGEAMTIKTENWFAKGLSHCMNLVPFPERVTALKQIFTKAFDNDFQ